jgi:hypothetical protein
MLINSFVRPGPTSQSYVSRLVDIAVRHRRRPIAFRSSTIGIWFPILQVLAYLAIVANVSRLRAHTLPCVVAFDGNCAHASDRCSRRFSLHLHRSFFLNFSINIQSIGI